MPVHVKAAQLLALKVKRLEKELERLKRRRDNWELCAVRQGETIRKYAEIMEKCERCLKEKQKLYGQTRRKKKPAR